MVVGDFIGVSGYILKLMYIPIGIKTKLVKFEVN
jgi:hypothetical protein